MANLRTFKLFGDYLFLDFISKDKVHTFISGFEMAE